MVPSVARQARASSKPLTFLSQHGDEGANELIIVVGPPLVVDLRERRMKQWQPALQSSHRLASGGRTSGRTAPGRGPGR